MSAISTVPNGVPALRAALSYHENVARQIRELIRSIESMTPDIDCRKYAGKRVAVALEEYLVERGGRATRQEALRALQVGGCDLGAIPSGNLNRVITQNPTLFVARGDRIQLTSWRETAA